jgi:hypothetical protein
MHDERLHGYYDARHQYSCLDMTLRSGLLLLEGWKDMRVLSVVRMDTRIGIEEVQWMQQTWVKLRAICGLNFEGEEKEAGKWLQDECSRIVSMPCIRFR